MAIDDKLDKGGNNFTSSNKAILGSVIIVVAAIIISIAIISLHTGAQSNNLAAFESYYKSSPNLNIYVNATNSSSFVNTLGCADSLIEVIIENKTIHKSPSDINLFIMNNTSCIYSKGLVNVENYSNASISKCLSYSNSSPTIMINEGPINKTIVSGKRISYYGTPAFIENCGIAYELSDLN
ncbi:hypothetical protein Mia14_0144 [Candidatus Mancarchaeum acidiphilum]|uniref:Uncharacterized protein n=1 Tax=Candidatus Mancarchaeum acidiphilum TaxID=1920749 RepID=A0A218NM02_9ARCH|nr:hypothetical protein [Candidatus Mancarchaeum acidiphilum]ASI13482.1 hypothetical protein Mia14_0144 [Candidatus Mancarchaeum acidiphilum]